MSWAEEFSKKTMSQISKDVTKRRLEGLKTPPSISSDEVRRQMNRAFSKITQGKKPA